MSFMPGMSGVRGAVTVGGLRLVKVGNSYKSAGGDGNNFTFSGVNYDPVFPGKALIGAVTLVPGSVLIASRLGTATVSGNNATIIFDDTNVSGAVRGSFFGIYDEANTSGNIVVTRTGSNQFARAYLTLYKAYDLKSLTAVDTLYVETGGSLGTDVPLSGNIDANQGGGIIAVGMSNDGASPIAWSGVTTDTEVDGGADPRTLFSSANRSRLNAGTKALGYANGISFSAISLR